MAICSYAKMNMTFAHFSLQLRYFEAVRKEDRQRYSSTVAIYRPAFDGSENYCMPLLFLRLVLLLAGDVETNPGPNDQVKEMLMLDDIRDIKSMQKELLIRVNRIEEKLDRNHDTDNKTLKSGEKSVQINSCNETPAFPSNPCHRSKDSQLGALIQVKAQHEFELEYYRKQNHDLRSKIDQEKEEKEALERHIVEILKKKKAMKHLISELEGQSERYDLGECEPKLTERHRSSEPTSGVDCNDEMCYREGGPNTDSQITPNKLSLDVENEPVEVHETKDKQDDEFYYEQSNNSRDPVFEGEEDEMVHDCTRMAIGKQKNQQITPHMMKAFQNPKESQSSSANNRTLREENSTYSLHEANKQQVQPNSRCYQHFMQAKQENTTDARVHTDFSQRRIHQESVIKTNETNTFNSQPSRHHFTSLSSSEDTAEQLYNMPKNSIVQNCIMKMKEPTEIPQHVSYQPEQRLDDSDENAVIANEKGRKISEKQSEKYQIDNPPLDEPGRATSAFGSAENEGLQPSSVPIKLLYPIKETISTEKPTAPEYGSMETKKSYHGDRNLERDKRSKQMQIDLENRDHHGDISQNVETKRCPCKQEKTTNEEKEIPNRILHFIADKIGSGWIDLMRTLDIDESRRENIEIDHKNYKERAFQGLLHWRRELGSVATLDKLEAALERVGRKDVRESL